MTKKVNKKKATKRSEERDREYVIALANTGEKLGNELMDLLSEFGCSYEALIIETYAMSKAWGALKAIAHSAGYEAEDLFNYLLPTFTEEMEGVVNEMKNER